MKRIKKYLTWYLLFTKRLLLKRSFLILLCIIPVITPVVKMAMSGESGVLNIVLCNEGENEMAQSVISHLMDSESIIRFSECSTEKYAMEKVLNHSADAAWIFDENFDEKLDEFTGFNSVKPVLKIIERESTVPLKLSRELLFGAMYRNISLLTYKNFVYSNMVTEEEIEDDLVRGYFTSLERENNIIEIQTMDAKPVKREENNYLTAPLRGILSLIVLLCALTAAMYFLKDNEEGRFNNMPPKKRILPAFVSCLSAVAISSVIVLVTLLFSGIWAGILNEAVSMLIYICTLVAFSLVFCVIFKSYGKLGAVIPGIMICALVLSPIFFSLKILKPLRLLIPTHYYLYSVYDSKYWLMGIMYSVIMLLTAMFLNRIKSHQI